MGQSRKRIGGLFWVLALIAFGAVCLFRYFGSPIARGEALLPYWPLLLLAWGLAKLVDLYLLRGALLRGDLRGLFSKGEVAILILTLIFGSAFSAASRLGSDLGAFGIVPEDLDLFDVLGENFEFVSTIESEAQPGRRIEIHDVYGSVDVQPADATNIIVRATTKIRAPDRKAAERLKSEMHFEIQQLGETYLIQSNREELRNSLQARFRSSLQVQVPTRSQVSVQNKYGTVRLTGLIGRQEIESRYGGTRVESIDGSLSIDDGHGPVRVERVSGDVSVFHSNSEVEVRAVDGDVVIKNRLGDVRVEDIRGDAAVDNTNAEVRGASISGSVRIRGINTSVDLEDVGWVDVDTTGRDVRVRDPRGSVRIANRYGDVHLVLSAEPEHGIVIAGDHTDVGVQLPATSTFYLDARTLAGTVSTDFEGMERVVSGLDRRIVGSTGGTGSRIVIETQLGNINVMAR